MKVELQYGAMTEPLKTQLEDQGITVNDVKLISKMQQKADMITKLYLSDLLTERESNKAHDRLHKQIISNLIPAKEQDDNFRPRIS